MGGKKEQLKDVQTEYPKAPCVVKRMRAWKNKGGNRIFKLYGSFKLVLFNLVLKVWKMLRLRGSSSADSSKGHWIEGLGLPQREFRGESNEGSDSEGDVFPVGRNIPIHGAPILERRPGPRMHPHLDCDKENDDRYSKTIPTTKLPSSKPLLSSKFVLPSDYTSPQRSLTLHPMPSVYTKFVHREASLSSYQNCVHTSDHSNIEGEVSPSNLGANGCVAMGLTKPHSSVATSKGCGNTQLVVSMPIIEGRGPAQNSLHSEQKQQLLQHTLREDTAGLRHSIGHKKNKMVKCEDHSELSLHGHCSSQIEDHSNRQQGNDANVFTTGCHTCTHPASRYKPHYQPTVEQPATCQQQVRPQQPQPHKSLIEEDMQLRGSADELRKEVMGSCADDVCDGNEFEEVVMRSNNRRRKLKKISVIGGGGSSKVCLVVCAYVSPASF